MRKKRPARSVRHQRLVPWLLLLLSLVLTPVAGLAQEVTQVFIAAPGPLAAGGRARLWLHWLNQSAQEVTRSFPARVDCRLVADGPAASGTLELREPADSGPVTLAPNAFARREYLLPLPSALAGIVRVEFPSGESGPVVLQAGPPEPAAVENIPAPANSMIAIEARRSPSDAVEFFQRHFYPHEPFYVIGGAESPNVKFQVSFKYRLFDADGQIGNNVSGVTNLFAGYTQTSLWDLKAASAPFFDSSYKPELLYLWNRAVGGRSTSWFRLDLQSGVRHESNGRAGGDSRSLNIAYFKPTVVFGHEDGFQFKLAPRAWFYAGGLGDNPDIKDYRGHVDLTAVVGWNRSVQLAALLRAGQDGRRGSAQFDLTYRLAHLGFLHSSLFLHAQYFTGYGESLLRYNQRDDSFRLGFSLFR